MKTTSFENLKNLEKRISDCTRKADTLPDEISDVQKNVDELLRNGPKVSEAVKRLDSLHEILLDAERKMEEINSARQGIGRSEQRLQELSRNIDSKFDLLKTLAQKNIEKNGVKGKTIVPQHHEQVRSLHRQGWTNNEIASTLKLTPGEVELILEIPPESPLDD